MRTSDETSYSQSRELMAEVERQPAPNSDPLELLIELEEELGCSILQALRIYRDHLKSTN